MRAHDWSSSPLGDPSSWPPSLGLMVSLMLNSRFPMFVAWGPELGFLYNDASIPVFGAKHPAAMGAPLRCSWSEIWDDIGPLIDAAMAGTACYYEDLPLLLQRHGFDEPTWFTFSYSPACDESGAVAGVFGVYQETTSKVLAERRLAGESSRLRQMFQQAPGFMVMLRGPEHVFELLNASYLRLIGDRDVLGKSVAQALPEVADQGFGKSLDKVYVTGEAITARNAMLRIASGPDGALQDRFLDYIYQPITDDSGAVDGIFVEGFDVTDRVHAEAALRESEAFTRRILESSADCIKVLGLDGTLEFMSAGGLCTMEIDDFSAFKGVAWPDFWREPGNHQKALDALAQANTGGTGRFQGYAPTAKGHMRYWDVMVTPIAGSDGAPEKLLSISRDISVQRTAEQALEEINATLAARVDERTRERDRLWQSSTDLLVVLGHDGGFREVNSAWSRVLGLEPDELIGRRMDRLVHPDDVASTEVALMAAPAGQSLDFSSRCRHKDGSYRWIQWKTVLTETDAAIFAIGCDITAAKAATAALHAAQSRIRAVFDTTGQFQAYLDAGGIVLDANPAALNAIDAALESVVGCTFWTTPWFSETAGASPLIEAGVAMVAAGGVWQQELTLALGSGERSFLFSMLPVRNAAGDIVGIVPQASETTAQRRAEEALRQSQKMEAVGQLTGGIAHDFNNMLAVVLGSLELLERHIGVADAKAQRYMNAANEGARRAAALTQRLLAFSRQQPLQPQSLDANNLVADISELLRHALGPGVQLQTVLAGDLWRIHADPNQLENVILNLAVNARDAMPDAGRLTIETQNVQLDSRDVADAINVTTGDYVLIAVTDTGTGMPAEVLAKAFDPFFTTKETGKGTGLGLSQVYGFVKQSGGHVKIESAPGHGTTLKIYLPRQITEHTAATSDFRNADALPRGSAHEVVLVVDDEPGVRQFSVDALEQLGYPVRQADGAVAALALLDAHPDIVLMFTDITMPDVNGAQLAMEARKRWPELKVLFTTGYARNAVAKHGKLDARVDFLIGKPFTVAELAAKVRGMLDAPG